MRKETFPLVLLSLLIGYGSGRNSEHNIILLLQYFKNKKCLSILVDIVSFRNRYFYEKRIKTVKKCIFNLKTFFVRVRLIDFRKYNDVFCLCTRFFHQNDTQYILKF
jgi:hypothetical protein